ncbi:unnamed protein product [Caenorhabditis sp. 36 PRJEB53466]|nr:unnamed protein product [Caenorhabditis sp. 36 PRJEB53466]
MGAIFWIFPLLTVCLAGRLQIVLPGNQTFETEKTSFDSQSLLSFNKEALGIEKNNGTFKFSPENLLRKPKTLVVISVRGLDDFEYDGHAYAFTDTFRSHEINENLRNQFGDAMIHVEVNSTGIFTNPHQKRASDSEAHDGPKEPEDLDDVANMMKLAESIRKNDRKSQNVVDFYRIHLDVSNARNSMQKRQLEENLKRGIDTLKEAIGERSEEMVLEIYTHHEQTEKEYLAKLEKQRRYYQVTRPRNSDFPAVFAICAGVALAMIFAVTSMVWFMWDEHEMGKNSLVYRLTTGRPKKD